MSSLIKFEFYNNFDIWYDLYQESNRDPNLYINMIVYSLKAKNGNGYGDGNGDSFLEQEGNGTHIEESGVENEGYGQPWHFEILNSKERINDDFGYGFIFGSGVI